MGELKTLALLFLLVLVTGCGRRVTRYYPNGVKQCEGRTAWNGPAENGVWVYWYDNGQVRERGSYDRGRREGFWTQWYPNGQKRAEGLRVFDQDSGAALRTGPWTFWWPEGQLRARGEFAAGARDGEWRLWHPEGSYDTERSGVYETGELADA